MRKEGELNQRRKMIAPRIKGERRKEMERLLDVPAVISWRALMHAFTAIFSQLEKGLATEGCSVSRFQVLFHLYFGGSFPAVEIAEKLFLTRGNISTLLKRMVSDGLIEPAVAPGQKRPLYALSEDGLLFFEKIFPAHIQRVRSLAPTLDLRTLRQLNLRSGAQLSHSPKNG